MTQVIIEVAINGVTSRERNPHVPCTPEEVAADALACLAAGAAIVHNHVDVFHPDGAEVAVFERGLARFALERGGHLRVGLEDYAGADQPRNEDLVRAAVELAAEVGRPVATCAETAAMLGLPRT